jgi:hypothetical protein
MQVIPEFQGIPRIFKKLQRKAAKAMIRHEVLAREQQAAARIRLCDRNFEARCFKIMAMPPVPLPSAIK